jgi:hypothetical protein
MRLAWCVSHRPIVEGIIYENANCVKYPQPESCMTAKRSSGFGIADVTRTDADTPKNTVYFL